MGDCQGPTASSDRFNTAGTEALVLLFCLFALFKSF